MAALVKTQRELGQANAALSGARAELDARPTQAEADELRDRLRILQVRSPLPSRTI